MKNYSNLYLNNIDELSVNTQVNKKKNKENKNITDKHTMSVLEFPKILAKIASLTMSKISAKLVKNIIPTSDLTKINRRQRRLTQLLTFLVHHDYQESLDELDNVYPLLIRLNAEGACLSLTELLIIANFLDLTSKTANFFKNSQDHFDELLFFYNHLTLLPDISLNIQRIIAPGNSIASSASTKLSYIRHNLNIIREHLLTKLNELLYRNDLADIFNNHIITTRANRFVISVRVNAKKQLNGIIHGTSSSGASYFLEPWEIIENNNELTLLRQKEKKEEKRILTEISRLLTSHLQILHKNLDILAKLDCLLAQTKFCQRLKCVEPIIDTEGQTDLIAVRHPLLAWQATINPQVLIEPINIHLNKHQQILVISGVNAGGKTATLKTIGLIALMTMYGIHLPCNQGSRIPIFYQILAEIGDEQSLNNGLSTFTAHASRLAWIINKTKKNSLVIIDEIGGNTDPNEGAALSIAILDWLKEQGAFVVCTTHFQLLKAYAAITENIENVSVKFDYQNNRSSYQLIYSLPGFAEALTVCQSLNFPKKLLETAKAQISENDTYISKFLYKLHQTLDKTKTAHTIAEADRLAANLAYKQACELLEFAYYTQTNYLTDIKHELNNITINFRKRLENFLKNTCTIYKEKETNKNDTDIKSLLISSPNQIHKKLHTERHQALQELQKTPKLFSLSNPTPSIPSTNKNSSLTNFHTYNTGDIVYLTNLGGVQGTLLASPRSDQKNVPVLLGTSGLRILVPLQAIKPLFKKHKTQTNIFNISITNTSTSDNELYCDVKGLIITQALTKINKALDHAISTNQQNLTIIHGLGARHLGNTIYNFLNNHPLVLSINQNKNYLGINEIIIANLR